MLPTRVRRPGRQRQAGHTGGGQLAIFGRVFLCSVEQLPDLGMTPERMFQELLRLWPNWLLLKPPPSAPQACTKPPTSHLHASHKPPTCVPHASYMHLAVGQELDPCAAACSNPLAAGSRVSYPLAMHVVLAAANDRNHRRRRLRSSRAAIHRARLGEPCLPVLRSGRFRVRSSPPANPSGASISGPARSARRLISGRWTRHGAFSLRCMPAKSCYWARRERSGPP